MRDIGVVLCKEINELTSKLIEFDLSIDQNFPANRDVGNEKLIDWGKNSKLSIVFKNIDYREIYKELNEDRNFNIKMIDGALIQLMYTIVDNKMTRHRLAFFPNPVLEQFQNDPDLYMENDLYADILAKNIVPVPIRFDYDESMHDEFHAKSHLSLGQYKNCRIPVSAPLNPAVFVDFILRNFYSNAYRGYNISLNSELSLERTITTLEEKLLHFNLI